MSFLAPGFFFASLAVAAGIVALHFIVTRQPRAGVLPTARFVPNLPATAIARATRPSDLPLLLLRVLLVLAAGAGLARPVFEPSRNKDVRIVLADVSRSVTDPASLRDSVKRVMRDGDALIEFDSSARRIASSAADSIGSNGTRKARGSISAALIAAMREGSALRERADSVELVVVSPFAAEELDDATRDIRKLWSGRIKLVRSGLGSSPSLDSTRQAVSVRSAAADPVAVTAGMALPTTNALIVRDGSAMTAGDASVVIDWPSTSRPRGAIARSQPDTSGGVASGETVVVANFPRRWVLPADSIRDGAVIARWIDGEPAGVEWSSAAGCIRSLAVPVSPAGDLAIRSGFVRFVESVAGPCADRRVLAPLAAEELAMLAGTGGLAARESFSPIDAHSWISPWLLGLALALAIAELFVRRRRSLTADVSVKQQKKAA
jgi:hypothetical protein